MIWLILIGLAAGALGGLLGVGGGVLFVPGLVIVVGLTQHEAEGTSLLAIVPVALVGALSQDRYGNVRRARRAADGRAVDRRRSRRGGAGQCAFGRGPAGLRSRC